MNTSLEAEVRVDQIGKGVARKLRKSGRVPAVVYGKASEPTSVSVEPKALADIFMETGNRNTVIQLSVDGKVIPCLVKEVQRHPLSQDMLHVDFYSVPESDTIQVMVPVRGVGRAKGMTIGGRLRLIRREVRIECNYKDIPESVDYDISPMEIGDMVKASELSIPKGCALVADHDFNVLTVYGKRVVAAEETAAAE